MAARREACAAPRLHDAMLMRPPLRPVAMSKLCWGERVLVGKRRREKMLDKGVNLDSVSMFERGKTKTILARTSAPVCDQGRCSSTYTRTTQRFFESKVLSGHH